MKELKPVWSFEQTINLKICMLFFCMLLVACKKKQELVQQQPTKAHQLSLQQDSGFVTKKIGLPFLITHQLTDTTGNPWDNVQDNDTIAKYYKVKKTGHFYYCTIDYSPEYTHATNLILELNQAGELLKSERFFHGYYTCCWKNRYEGFQKYEDYFGIKTCSTGSGFCAAHLYLFKNLVPQNTLEPVLIDYWEAMGGEDRNPRSLTSSLTIQNDKLLVHYKLEEGKIVNDTRFKVQKTRRFDVPYTVTNNQWLPQDSTMFKLGILW